MKYGTVQYSVSDAIATLTLARPEALNAYLPDMGEDIVAAFRTARDDRDIKALIMTGSGRGFCAGMDRSVAKGEIGPSGLRIGDEEFIRSFAPELANFPKPTIAAVNGPAAGIGVTCILPFDIRIGSASASFTLPFLKLGILPGLGSTHLLPKLIGAPAALDLLSTGRTIDAAEALRFGLITQLVSDDALISTARDLANAMATVNPDALQSIKEALELGRSSDIETAMATEKKFMARLRDAGKRGA